MEYCGARRRDTHISEPAHRYVYPLFFLLLLKEVSSYHLKEIVTQLDRNQTTCKGGILWRSQGAGGIHISLNNNNNNNNNNNTNELYLHDHTSTCSFAKAIFKNQNYITVQLRYFDNNLSRTSKQAEIYFMHREMCIPCFFFSC